MTLITILYLSFAIREIRKAQQTVDIDQVILGIEMVKVSTTKTNTSDCYLLLHDVLAV